MELARKLGWSTLSSAVLLFVAAIASNATGVQVADGAGDVVNSHAPATWVLGCFGLVLLLNSLFLFAWANQQLWNTRRRG